MPFLLHSDFVDILTWLFDVSLSVSKSLQHTVSVVTKLLFLSPSGVDAINFHLCEILTWDYEWQHFYNETSIEMCFSLPCKFLIRFFSHRIWSPCKLDKKTLHFCCDLCWPRNHFGKGIVKVHGKPYSTKECLYLNIVCY